MILSNKVLTPPELGIVKDYVLQEQDIPEGRQGNTVTVSKAVTIVCDGGKSDAGVLRSFTQSHRI